MTPQNKKWIDNASYEQLLRKWRSAPVGDSLFLDDTGEYYKKVMKEKRDVVGNDEHVKASKNIGW